MAHLRPEESHSSPYFLHPNENPSLMLVATPLNGQNYYAWSRAMRMALISKNKIKFVDGSIIVPSVDDPLYPAWERCNTMVLSWLVQSLAATISQSVISFDSAYEIWNDLKDRFSQGDHVRVSDLQQELYSLRQGSLSVTEYFTHLKILWDEFVSLRPIPVCSCAPKCSCDGYFKMKSYYDNDYTLRFIRGLNETYSNIKSQMFMLDPLPKINKVFGLVIQQERQSAVPLLPTPTETSVFYSNARAGPYKPNFNNSRSPNTFNSQRKFYPTKFNMNNNLPECAFCGGSGHSIDRCFKKHGYPPGHPGFRPQGKQVISSANMAEGQYCTESYQNNSEFHNSDNDQYDMPSSYDETMQQNQQNMVNLSFTPDQYMKILALIQPTTAQNPSSQIHAPSSSQIHAPPNINALQAQFDAANTAKISGIGNQLMCRSKNEQLVSTCSQARPKPLKIYTGNEKKIMLFLLVESIVLVVLAGLVRFCCIFWSKKKLQGQDLGNFLAKRRSLQQKKKEYDRTITELEEKAAEAAVGHEIFDDLGDLVRERQGIERKLSTTYSLGRDRTNSQKTNSILPVYDGKSRSYSFQSAKKENVTIFRTLSDSSSERKSSSGNETDSSSWEEEEAEERQSIDKAKGKAPIEEAESSSNEDDDDDADADDVVDLKSSSDHVSSSKVFIDSMSVESIQRRGRRSSWLKRRRSMSSTN